MHTCATIEYGTRRSRHACIRALAAASTSSTVLRTFQCFDLDDGSRYLRADFSIDCDSTAHQLHELYAYVMVLLYPSAQSAMWCCGAAVVYGALLCHGAEVPC